MGRDGTDGPTEGSTRGPCGPKNIPFDLSRVLLHIIDTLFCQSLVPRKKESAVMKEQNQCHKAQPVPNECQDAILHVLLLLLDQSFPFSSFSLYSSL